MSMPPDQWAQLTPEQRQQFEMLWARMSPEQRWQFESRQMQRQMFAAHQASEDRRRRELIEREQHRQTYNLTAGGIVLGCLVIPVLIFILLLILI